MIGLAYPTLLLLGVLLLLPLLVRRQRAWHYSSLLLLHGARPSGLATRLTWGITIAALSLLLIALARPQGGMAQSQQIQEVRDIVLTLDLSLSMDTPIASASGQKYTTRLDVVQQATLEFVRRRQHDRLALLVFGDETFGAWPLSTDSTTLQYRLQHLRTLLPAPMRGTHVAKALGQSLDYLQIHGQARTKMVLLMTDGLDLLTPETQARLAQRFEQQRVTLYVLGLDLPATSNIMQFIRQAGAHYFNITKVEELDNAIRDIERLETSYVTVTQPTTRQELYPYFAMPAILLLFVATVLHSTWVVEV